MKAQQIQTASDWHALAYMADVVLTLNERLAETAYYRRQLKMHGNGFKNELERLVDAQYQMFAKQGEIDGVHGLELHYEMSRNYDHAFEFFTKYSPSEVSAAMIFLQNEIESGRLNLAKVKVELEQVEL